MKKIFLAVMLSMLMLVGCSNQASNLILTLSAIQDASSVAVIVVNGMVAAGKIDPLTATTVNTYAKLVSGAVTVSITELGTTDTNTRKITVITQAFASLTAPHFGPNVSAQVQAIVQAIGTSIQLFLSQLGGTPSLMAKLTPHAEIKLTSGDKALLKQIQVKSQNTIIMANTR